MPAEKIQDVLRLLERASADHTSWLLQVHSRLLFPEEGAAPGAPEPPPQVDLCLCDGPDALAPMLKARKAMYAAADRLLAAGRDEGLYREFMARVDDYGREARRAEAYFHRSLVETDPLTGVHNRQGMMRDLRREWTRALRTGRPCCLAIADLDHFKLVNDTWGHGAGDRVLCAAAGFFKRQLRPYDLVYRYGGEEFLFCLPDADAATATHVLDRLRALLGGIRTRLDCGTEVGVTCSIGVAEMRPGMSVPDTIAAADHALYEAKRGGRDRVEVDRPDLDAFALPQRTQRTQHYV